MAAIITISQRWLSHGRSKISNRIQGQCMCRWRSVSIGKGHCVSVYRWRSSIYEGHCLPIKVSMYKWRSAYISKRRYLSMGVHVHRWSLCISLETIVFRWRSVYIGNVSAFRWWSLPIGVGHRLSVKINIYRSRSSSVGENQYLSVKVTVCRRKSVLIGQGQYLFSG